MCPLPPPSPRPYSFHFKYMRPFVTQSLDDGAVGPIIKTLAAIPGKCLQPFYCLIICTAQPKFVLPKYFR